MAHTPRTSASGSQAPGAPSRQQPPPSRQQPRAHAEQRGCLFALAQLPLIIFLAVVGSLLLLGALHDLFLL